MPYSLEQVKAMFNKAGVTDTFATKREIKQLPNILEDSEIILYATSGILDTVGIEALYGVRDGSGGTVLVVLTDRRLIFIDKGLIYGIKVADIPFEAINSVTYIKGLVLGSISIAHGSKTFNVKNVAKNTANIFAAKTKEQLSKVKQTRTSSQHESANSHDHSLKKIKELKELLDLGAITKAEFDKKKNELLNL